MIAILRKHQYVSKQRRIVSWIDPGPPFKCGHCGHVTGLSEWQLRELLRPSLWRCRAATAPRVGFWWWLPAGVDTVAL